MAPTELWLVGNGPHWFFKCWWLQTPGLEVINITIKIFAWLSKLFHFLFLGLIWLIPSSLRPLFCLFLCCSWDNVHLRAGRSPHHIHLATQWPAEHTGRPAGSGLQHAAEGSHSGQGGECQRTGRLPGAAHSKILFLRIFAKQRRDEDWFHW